MPTITFKLVTPERTVLSKELNSLSCPTTLGQITILPGHEPLVATLVPGELHAKSDKEDFFLFVSGGFVQVNAGNQAIILADAAEHHYEIDEQRAKEAKEQAEKALKEFKGASEDYAKVAAALEKSLTRLNIIRKHAHKKNPLTGQGTLSE